MSYLASLIAATELRPIPLRDNIRPHVLCGLCQHICETSVVVQTYVKYGEKEDAQTFHKRCYDLDARESFEFHRVLEHLASYQLGCHLCAMLWLGSMPVGKDTQDLIMERLELEFRKGKSSSTLIITCPPYHDDMQMLFHRTPKDAGPSCFRLRGYTQSNLSDPHPSPHFPLQSTRRPTAEEFAQIIDFWFTECCQKHETCRLYEERVRSSEFVPSRLIDVSDPSHPRLVNGDAVKLDQRGYVTLSHCWPKRGNITKLTKANFKDYEKGISVNQLSQVFKDAIAIANTANFKHIWIDSLCIVQDSISDWATEANLMSYVYGNAALNLVAVDPPGGRATMFGPRDPLAHVPCRLSSGDCSLYVEPNSQPNLRDVSLFTRGWIVQERLLSRRNIYFGLERLVWECFDGHATETHPLNKRPTFDKLDSYSLVSDFEHKIHFQRLLDASEHFLNDKASENRDARVRFARSWEAIIGLYSPTKLTYSTDKLAAIAGIASAVKQKTSLRYIAGMWMCTLPAGLLWQNWPASLPGQRKRPSWRGAPSWSWASVEGDIYGSWPAHLDSRELRHLKPEDRFTATILGCRVTEVRGRIAPLGEVEEARLRIRSVLRTIGKLNPDENGHSDGKSEFSSDLVSGTYFDADALIPDNTPLLFLTIFRGWTVCDSNPGDMAYREEGLVVTPYRDGYTRVGYMRVHFVDEDTDAMTALLWGDGKMETVFLF